MRRAERAISREEALAALAAAEYGILSMTGPAGEPYGVPLNFVLTEDGTAILFHSAIEGRKLVYLRARPYAHFSVVCAAQVVPEALTTAYTCVMVEGAVTEVTDPEEKKRCACLIASRYAPGRDASGYAGRSAPRYVVLRMSVDGVSGKRRPLPGMAERNKLA